MSATLQWYSRAYNFHQFPSSDDWVKDHPDERKIRRMDLSPSAWSKHDHRTTLAASKQTWHITQSLFLLKCSHFFLLVSFHGVRFFANEKRFGERSSHAWLGFWLLSSLPGRKWRPSTYGYVEKVGSDDRSQRRCTMCHLLVIYSTSDLSMLSFATQFRLGVVHTSRCLGSISHF